MNSWGNHSRPPSRGGVQPPGLRLQLEQEPARALVIHPRSPLRGRSDVNHDVVQRTTSTTSVPRKDSRPGNHDGRKASRGWYGGKSPLGHANAADSIHSFPDSARTIADTVSQSLEDVDPHVRRQDAHLLRLPAGVRVHRFRAGVLRRPRLHRARRCKSCRATRKAAGGGSSAGGGYGSGGGGGYSSGGGGYRPAAAVATVVAPAPAAATAAAPARCSRRPALVRQGRPVPFQPTSGKPVYCNDCFARRRG